MKKIIACISLVFAMSAGVTALAAEDPSFVNDETKDAITVGDASAYKTVLIEKDTDILYVDQIDTGLSAASNFLIKAPETEEGTYTVKMGGNDGEPYSRTLVISNEVLPTVTPLAKTNEKDNGNGTRDIACFAEGVAASACNYAVITVTKEADSKTAYYEFTTTCSGDGDMNVAIRVTNVPTGYDVAIGVSDVMPSAAE